MQELSSEKWKELKNLYGDNAYLMITYYGYHKEHGAFDSWWDCESNEFVNGLINVCPFRIKQSSALLSELRMKYPPKVNNK